MLQIHIQFVRFEVLLAVNIKITVFWDGTDESDVKVHRYLLSRLHGITEGSSFAPKFCV
jgi:hypothetical protein